jgi:hypothetical protein
MQQPFTFYVPADPIRAHVKGLRDFGIGHRQLAKIANVSPIVIQTLMNGHSTTPGKKTTRITYGAAHRLLKIQPEHRHLADGAMIDARGSQRRIQALCVQGYSLRWQATMIGTKYPNYHRILINKKITKQMADRVDELYQRLKFTPHRSDEVHGKKAISITKGYARKNKWVAAAAWINIDTDPKPPTKG